MITQITIKGRTISIQPIRRKLYEERYLDIGLLLPEVVERVLPAHLSHAKLTDPDAYAALLDKDNEEYQRLLADLLAPPDRFFADPMLTSLLTGEILPSILARKQAGEPVRVWIANCGEGYLCYDVALTVRKLMTDADTTQPIRLLGSFADEAAANRARGRDYPEERLRELEKNWPAIGNANRTLGQVRNIIVFGTHDLLTQTSYAGIDLAICSGYLPLLTPEQREIVTGKLIHSLVVHGVLLAGRGETLLLDTPPPTEEQPFGLFRKQVSHPSEIWRSSTIPSGLVYDLAELLDKFADPVMLVSKRRVIIAANAAAKRSFGKEGTLDRRHLREIGLSELASRLGRAIAKEVFTGASLVTGDQNWTVGVARLVANIGAASAAVAFIPNDFCEDHARLTEADYHAECRERALKTAELAAQVLNSEDHISALTRQASLVTGSIYARNQELAAVSDELRQRNAELQDANEQLRIVVADRERAQTDLRTAFDREHHIAETLQQALLPPLPDRVDGYTLAVRYQAAAEEAEVGGDFYHGGRIDDSRYLLALGDVAGKGLGAAVMGAMTKYMLVGFSAETPDPAMILLRLNEALVSQQAGEADISFITLACVLANVKTGTLYYASAGHEPAMLYRAAEKKTELIQPTGKALGVMGGHEYTATEITMERGDLLFMYTDGISDAGVPDRPLGIDGLLNVLNSCATQKPSKMLDTIYDAALKQGGGKLRDDAASLLLKREV